MRNAHPRYTCYPSVVCTGRETTVTIFPRDTSRIFREEDQYQLAVVGLREDQISYHDHIPLDYPCTIVNGCLQFTYFFDQEQEYSIRIAGRHLKETKLLLYAVDEDLYCLRPLKGDLHSHTYYSDGQDGLTMTPADYREEGFDFYALTDHNRMYTSDLAMSLYADIPLGMHMMRGEEVHTPGSLLHIVHAGGTDSVCSRYIHTAKDYETEVSEIEKTLPHIPETYRRRVAMAHWAVREIHKVGGLAILAHPYWCPNRYNLSEEFCNLLFEEQIFDAFELVGGVNHKGVNLQMALWQEHAFKGHILPVVGSSDSHNHDYEQRASFGRNFTIVWAASNTTEDILDAIRKGYSVAAEVSRSGDNEVHFYGAQRRLIAFAHFLFENYFNETWRLCIGEGILMRRYAEGEPIGDILAALAPTVENYYKKFYGLTPAPVLSETQIAFLDHCRDIQCSEGPETKGSSLFFYGSNERRV